MCVVVFIFYFWFCFLLVSNYYGFIKSCVPEANFQMHCIHAPYVRPPYQSHIGCKILVQEIPSCLRGDTKVRFNAVPLFLFFFRLYGLRVIILCILKHLEIYLFVIPSRKKKRKKRHLLFLFSYLRCVIIKFSYCVFSGSPGWHCSFCKWYFLISCWSLWW